MQELMVRGIIKDAVWIGASARCLSWRNPISAMGMMVGYQFQNNMQIGYSYDLILEIPAWQVFNGSHEIMVGIRFTKKKCEPIIPADEFIPRVKNWVESLCQSRF